MVSMLMKKKIRAFVTAALSLWVSQCGGAGKSVGGGGEAAVVSEVTGSVVSQTGSSDGFDGWMIAIIDRDTGVSRVAEIDSAGKYLFQNVEEGKAFTMVMLTPSFRLSSVLSMVAAEKPKKVYQYFKLKNNTIPQIEHRGPNFEFSDPSLVQMLTDYASDEDSDGIPDGMEGVDSSELSGIAGKAWGALKLAGDEDKDKFLNEIDADVDGDGLVNWFDDDDDGNGVFDVFDIDANNDGGKDVSQTVGDHYFDEEIEYIGVQLFVKLDGDVERREMRFVVKVADGVVPAEISVRGDATLFDDSEVVIAGADGEEVGDIWNKTLLDDGDSFDQSADDGIYARKVRLNTGVEPEPQQVVFLRVGFGDKKNMTYKELPFTFPELDLGEVSFTYDAGDFRITKEGSPFGEDENEDVIDAYLWSVSVFDEQGTIVHSSTTLEGAAETYDIDSDDLEDDETYTAKIYAQSLAKAKGYPVFVIESSEETLE